MTHEELLAKIKLRKEATKWINAVNAVIELHKPSEQFEIDAWCLECTTKGKVPAYYTIYPCPTIQAIEKELQ